MKTCLALVLLSISSITMASSTTYNISETFNDGNLGTGLSHSTFIGKFQISDTYQITGVTGYVTQSTNYGATPAYYQIDPSSISQNFVNGNNTQVHIQTYTYGGTSLRDQINLVVSTINPTQETVAAWNWMNTSMFGLDNLYNYSVLSYNITAQPSAVPLSGALWLFLTGILGFFGYSRRKSV